MTNSNNDSTDSVGTDDLNDVSAAADPDAPSGVVDLSSQDEMSPEDVYKQILDMRDDASGEPDQEAVDASVEGEEPDDSGSASAPESELKEKYLRALADLENLRKRQQRNTIEMRKYGHETAIRELLPVFDNLERAVAAAGDVDEESELGKFIAGTAMIMQQFVTALDRVGVKKVDAVGQKFDPQLHEAVQELPSPDQEPNTIVHELEKGYQLYDRLIRPAKVVVSKAAAASESVETADENPEAPTDDLDLN